MPRIVVAWGPPGYEKSRFLHALAERSALAVRSVDLPRPGEDLERPIVEALVSGDPSRSAVSAASRLAERPELAAIVSRETLRAEWARLDVPEMFVFRDAGGALSTPAGVDLFRELLLTLPPGRTLGVMTRASLAPALAHLLGRERVISVGPDDLALADSGVAELSHGSGVPAAIVRRMADAAGRRPLVVRMLVELARAGGAETLVEAAEALSPDGVLSFAAHRTIAMLDGIVREALIVAALLGGATQAELVRILGADCDDFVFARLLGLAFVDTAHERAAVHPVVANLLKERFAAAFRSLYERTLHALTGDGAYAAAARVALAEGDVVRAAAVLDAAPSYTAQRLPLAEYERILDRLDRDLITQYANVWLATIPYRAFSVDRTTYVREAETVYYCLPASANVEQRTVVLIHLSSGYANIGRLADSDLLIEEGLQGFARDHAPMRAMLLRFAATLRGIEGRFTLARAYSAEAEATFAASAFYDSQTLHYIDAHEAAFRGRYDLAVVMFDELIKRMTRDRLPLYLAYAAMNGAFVAWVSGDDEPFERYLRILDESLTPGIRAGFAPMIDGARGRALRIDDRHPWPVIAAIAHLYRLAVADSAADALEAARDAVSAADERRDPYVQLVAHAALFVLDRDARPKEKELLSELAANVESPEMQDAVRRLIGGEPAGILEGLVRRRLLRERDVREPPLVVELLAARVTRAGVPVKVSDKEMEFLALLASSAGPVSRDRIGEALWDHLDPSEWPNNIKVTLSRIRTKLGVRDAVLHAHGGYRLSPALDVDIAGAEALLRTCRTDGIDETRRARLREIVAAYRSGSAARYERFSAMFPGLARVNDVACTAGLLLAAHDLGQDLYDDAITNARAVAEIDPFDEGACEITIKALLARGEGDAARREFRRYAKTLAEGLGAKPSANLLSLASANVTAR